jgi:uncharacterized ferritin-like protein (DUF455 family)
LYLRETFEKYDVAEKVESRMSIRLRGSASLISSRCISSINRSFSSLESLLCYGGSVLRSPNPSEKVALTLECKQKWDDSEGKMPLYVGEKWLSNPPLQPKRGSKPLLYESKDMPSMKDMDTTIPIAMLHALAHIELGAIDNYWDTIIRFDPVKHQLPYEFYDDFLTVASDEARHFQWVDDRLRELGSFYGYLPAHKALLEHASNTASDLAARIAVVPLVQEARGLDSGDRLVHKLKSVGDKKSADIVAQIVWEERSHVAFGVKWFKHLCQTQNKEIVPYFHELVLKYFPEGLPGPFDMEARLSTGMEPSWYQPLESKHRHLTSKDLQATTTTSNPTKKAHVKAMMSDYKDKKVAILVGIVWPERTSSAAGVRSSDLIEILQENGWQILCVSPSRLNEHTQRLESEFNVHCFQADANTDLFQKILLQVEPNMVLFDRFIAEEMYGWQAQKYAPQALRVLDLQDVHFLRKTREYAVKKMYFENIPQILDPFLEIPNKIEQHVIRELTSIHRSDLTLYVSEYEKELLINRFQVAPNVLYGCNFFYPSHPLSSKPFEDRQHIAFIGSFKHEPNVDAVQWFKKSILPFFPSNKEPIEFHIYGSYASQKNFKMEDTSKKLFIKGFTPNVHETLQNYRLSIAPLRFGAGIKGKIADSWYNGTPCVSTSVGSEGMVYDNKWGGRIADDPQAFVQAMKELYFDKNSWYQAQKDGFQLVSEKYDRETNANHLMQTLNKALNNLSKTREANWMGRILWSEKYRSSEYMSKYIQAKNTKLEQNP